MVSCLVVSSNAGSYFICHILSYSGDFHKFILSGIFSSECKPIFMNLFRGKTVCGQLNIILLYFNLGKSICDRLSKVFFLQRFKFFLLYGQPFEQITSVCVPIRKETLHYTHVQRLSKPARACNQRILIRISHHSRMKSVLSM